MSGLGILASLVGGSGDGVSYNAKQSMLDKAREREEQRLAAIRTAENEAERKYQSEQYQQKLSDQERLAKEEQAWRSRENQLDRNAKVSSGGNSGSAKLSEPVKAFNTQANDIIGNIEKTLTSSTYLDEEQRKSDLAYFGSQLDELVNNNPQYLMYDPENAIYHNPIASRSFSVLNTLGQMLGGAPVVDNQGGDTSNTNTSGEPFIPPTMPAAHNDYVAPASERSAPHGYQTAPGSNLPGNAPSGILQSLKSQDGEVRPPRYLTGG